MPISIFITTGYARLDFGRTKRKYEVKFIEENWNFSKLIFAKHLIICKGFWEGASLRVVHNE